MGSLGTILVIGCGDRESRRLGEYIEEGGYDAVVADDWRDGLRELYNCHPDAAVLLLEGADWSNVERMRQLCDIPMVLVTSHATRGSLQRAYDLGLQGFLTKPLRPGELVGRVTAIVQRVSNNRNNRSDPISVLRLESLTIDLKRMEVQLEGAPVHLSPTEFRLLSLLAERRGWVVPYDEILAKVWGPAYVGDRNSVKLYICYLRRKLEVDPANPRWILTKYGVGYTFCGDEMHPRNGHASQN
jgi:two-component system KDP operon response regulator KdpE